MFDIEAAKHLVEEGQTEQVRATHCIIIIIINIEKVPFLKLLPSLATQSIHDEMLCQ